jgi:hypothetical protein
LDQLSLQIFLDRQQFSAGPIAGEPGETFARILLLYQSTHEDAKDDASLGVKARAAVGNVFTRYKLRAEDFRFIAPPKAETIVPPKRTPASVPAHLRKTSSKPTGTGRTHPTYEELTALPMLPYRTPWEFIAERFHCQESYLHYLNPKLPATPPVGSEFRVPNVIPFEIENTFDEPLQPQPDSDNPVTAAVIGLSQLNIYKRGAPNCGISHLSCLSRAAWARILDDPGRDPASPARDVAGREDRTKPETGSHKHKSGADGLPNQACAVVGAIPCCRSQKPDWNRVDQSGEGKQHRTAAVWPARDEYPRSNEPRAEYWWIQNGKLGYHTCRASSAIWHPS